MTSIDQIEAVPVHAGTVPVPPDWYYKGWSAS
jgi:hypothetical protein